MHADVRADRPDGAPAPEPMPEPSKSAAIALGAITALLAWFVFATTEHYMDDAFIGFAFLRNLLAGDGFVFFAGTSPVEGVTNIGWLLFLAPFAAILPVHVAAKGAGVVLLVVALLLTLALSRRAHAGLRGVPLAATVLGMPALIVATRFDFIYFAVAGMETALLATLVLLMALAVWSRPASLLAPVLGAAAFTVHPEAGAIYPLYVAFALLAHRRVASWVLPAIAYAVLIAILTAARYGYFGDVVPNTFYSKPGNIVLQINTLFEFLTGHTANIPFPIVGILALVPLGLGYRMLRRLAPPGAHMLAAATVAGLLFCLYSRPDWTLHGRYFAPYLPAAAILFWIGIVGFAVPFVERLGPRARRRHAAAAAAIVVFVGLLGIARAMLSMDFFPGYVLAGRTLVEPARWMRDNLPADATIATRRIGALAYVSGRRVFDYTYGLTDRDVARLIAARGKPFYNPAEAGLAPVWKRAAPRYVIEDENILDSIARDGEGTLEKFTVHGFEYRVIRRFPIGRTVLWALAERTDPGALADVSDAAPASYSEALGSLSSPSGGNP